MGLRGPGWGGQRGGTARVALDGSPLVYNQRAVRIPDLLICHPGMSASFHDAIATLV
jgi:hypothetical protein